ncbi:hypothetical protein SO694_00176022 [Aureococcus anophagefferens]|uniref:CS domain-containing protein n=1 Tax=Aureococcus anophagefferens TaxID=44056 RepID=A0ABR1FGS2_AURAN
MSAYSNDYSKWDALSDSDDDKPQVLLKRADPRKAAHFAAQSAAANGPEPPPAKRYSLEMGNDGPCVVEGDAPPPPDPDAPFETKMAWQNTLSRAFVQIAIPEATKKGDVAVNFSEASVEIVLAGMRPVALPHPAVKVPLCTWAFSRKCFYGSKFPQLCVHFELEKAEDALWPQNTFGGGTDEVLPAEEEIEAAWAAPTDEAAPPAPAAGGGEWTGEFSWRQDNKSVVVWFDVPDETRAKDLIVKCTPTTLRVELTVGATTGRYVRTLAGPVLPEELIWEFDDDVPGKKRLRVELAMRTLASWENGPFLPEADTAGKGLRQHSWSEPKGEA